MWADILSNSRIHNAHQLTYLKYGTKITLPWHFIGYNRYFILIHFLTFRDLIMPHDIYNLIILIHDDNNHNSLMTIIRMKLNENFLRSLHIFNLLNKKHR